MRVMAVAAMTLMALTGVAAAQQVGVTSAVNQSAVGLAPAGKTRIVQIGDQVIHDEKFTTDAKGLMQILLVDGTTFTVGPNSSMTIDKFVYDPNAGTAQVVATLSKGAFRFIGGKSSKSPDGVTLNTPVGTVGVRGGISNLDFTGATAYHIDMVYGDGVTLKDGTKIIGDLYHSGYSIVIGADGKVGVEKTPPEWGKTFQSLMSGSNNGGSGSVKSDEIKTALNPTNGAPPTGQPGGNPPASGLPQVIPPDPSQVISPLTTLAQIQNSDLATVTGYYGGQYDATLTNVDENRVVNSGTGNFDLQYQFATGAGTMVFEPPGDTEGGVVYVPVAASNPNTTGLASFTNDGNPFGDESGFSFDLNGNFLNTSNSPDGIGRGVAGTFSASGPGTILLPNDPDYEGPPQNLELNGSFGGNLQTICPPNCPG